MRWKSFKMILQSVAVISITDLHVMVTCCISLTINIYSSNVLPIPALELSLVFLWFCGCRLYSDGLELGSDLWLPAVVLWNSALMFQPCFDRILICLIDILHTPLRSARCFSRRHRRALEKQGQKKQTKHSKQQDNTSMTVTVLVPGIRLFNFGNYCLILRSTFATRFVCFF